MTISAFLRRQIEQSHVVSSGKSVSISNVTAPQWQLPRQVVIARGAVVIATGRYLTKYPVTRHARARARARARVRARAHARARRHGARALGGQSARARAGLGGPVTGAGR